MGVISLVFCSLHWLSVGLNTIVGLCPVYGISYLYSCITYNQQQQKCLCVKQFVEVVCKSSGKARRFAAGTEAGFAVSLINRKVEGGPIASHIEAVKEGEEPVGFGPNSILVNYGDGWKLQTVTGAEGDFPWNFSLSEKP